MTDSPALHRLMSWLSPAFPVGAFSYSHGLDWSIAEGEVSNAEALFDWCETCLTLGAGRTDAIFTAHAMRVDVDGLQELAELATAFSATSERRLETVAQGAAFARAVVAIQGIETPVEDPPYPVAFGWCAARVGLTPEVALPLFLHAVIANYISAAVRAVPLGQTEGQRVLARLFPICDRVASEALSTPVYEIGGAMFRGDMASMKHETQYSRMFRS